MTGFFAWKKPRLKVSIAGAAAVTDFILLSFFFLGFAVDLLGGSLITRIIYRPFHATIIPSVLLFIPAILSRDAVPNERGLRTLYVAVISLSFVLCVLIMVAGLIF